MNAVLKRKEKKTHTKTKALREQFPKEGQSYIKMFMFYVIFITTR